LKPYRENTQSVHEKEDKFERGSSKRASFTIFAIIFPQRFYFFFDAEKKLRLMIDKKRNLEIKSISCG